MAKGDKQQNSVTIEQQGQHPINVFNNPHGYYSGMEQGGSTIDTIAPEYNDANRMYPVGSRSNPADTGQYAAQLVPYKFHRKAVIDINKDMVWQQILSDTVGLGMHSGTKIKGYRYLPLLDDRNINDQGIDAAGLQIENGNLYGSSKDPAVVNKNMPILGEFGGRVNRVGFSRTTYEGDLKQYGFFWEYSDEAMMFDSDSELYSNFVKLSLEAANEIVEYNIMQDFLINAGTNIYAGGAANAGAVTEKISYDFLMDMYDKLYENRVPEQTKIIKGSRLIDTKVVGSGYFVYIPFQLARQVREMKDNDGNPVFVGVEHYAYSNTKDGKLEGAMGEIGKIGPFRFIVVRNMTQAFTYDASTKTFTTATDVYPLVVVGEGAAKGITLHTNSKGKGRYKIFVKKPGYTTADFHDPYGKRGFYSIQWWSGFIAQRPERIVVGYVHK
jgi:N4-gp56 family major capsid protein